MVDREKLRARFEMLADSMEVGLFGTISEEDVRGVLEILKDEPNVVPLDEVKANHERIVWVEWRYISRFDPSEDFTKLQPHGKYVGKVWPDSANGREWAQFRFLVPSNEVLNRPEDEYGKTWRCWSAMPSDEMRERVKWDD